MERLFSFCGSSVVLWLMLISPALAAAPGIPHLSAAQASVVARQIAKLNYPQERALATGWTDAKKAAEFICRPLAKRVLKRRFKNADRVFLGTADPKTLHLVSNRRLEGSGQVRTGDRWRAFTFVCALDPRTGKAVSFKARAASANGPAQPSENVPASSNWPRYFGPGPVRSPTFNPQNWPGSKRRQK